MMKLNLSGRRIPTGPRLTLWMYEVGMAGAIIAALAGGWWATRATWGAAERAHARRALPANTRNAELAARNAVWAWMRYPAWPRTEAHATWSPDDMRVTCRSTGATSLCRVTGLDPTPAFLECDNGTYPYNGGCVWQLGPQDQGWRR